MEIAAPRVCIDIDNTLAATDTVMRQVIGDYTSGRVRLKYEDIVHFNYDECVDRNTNGISRNEWKEIHARFSEPRYLWQIEPMPGALEGLMRLQDGLCPGKSVAFHFATSRLRSARRTTVEWLDAHGFPDHYLHFLKHGEKHAALRPFAAAVEDHYEQAAAFAADGTPCFLIRHPWNRDREPQQGLTWVDTWDELACRLLELLA